MRVLASAAFALVLFCAPLACVAQTGDSSGVGQELESLGWRSSPSACQVMGVATLTPIGDLRCLDATGTHRFLELNGNPPRDDEYTLAPKGYAWFALFSFEDSGYVKDQDDLNPDELLQTYMAQNKRNNERRKQLGMGSLTLTGWYLPPHYNVETRQLEWGERLVDEKGNNVVNYFIKILGRGGVTTVNLVSDPEHIAGDLVIFRSALTGFSYNAGQHYEEFRDGDKVAEYGLSALVLGGAGAVAAKSGLFKVFGKFIFALGAAAVAGASALVKRIRSALSTPSKTS